MEDKIAIHETAFVTSAFRAGDVSLSKDIYAYLWLDKKAKHHADNYVREVSQYEPLAHCLRNRFFYERIKELYESGQIEVLINFGSGFSMYPFLLHKGLRNIEIDLPYLVAYKKKRIDEWQASGKLPGRDIHFISADFKTGSYDNLLAEINEIKEGKPSFILIEGVLFFLSANETSKLFTLFKTLQQLNAYVGSVSFRNSQANTAVFQKLLTFAEANLEKNERFTYQTLDPAFYANLPGYRLQEHQDTHSLALMYIDKILANNADVLMEDMYLLKKI